MSNPDANYEGSSSNPETEQKIGGSFRTAQVPHSTVSFWDRDQSEKRNE